MSNKEELFEATFDEIYNDPSSQVFVLNITKAEKAGVVQMTVTPGNEQPMSVTVPHTWAPFDLTAQVSKRHLMESSNFRRALNSKMLKLLDTKSAIKYLNDHPDAALENSKAVQNLNGVNGLEEHNREKTIQDARDNAPNRNAMQIAREKLLANANSHPEFTHEGPDTEVTLKLQEAISRTDITEPELYSIVRGLAHENGNDLNAIDRVYIMENVKHTKVLHFVNNLGK